MMTGLPGDSDDIALKTCEDIIFLKPDMVRIYPTIVLEGTHLAELYKNSEYIPQTVGEATELCAQLLEKFNNNKINVIRLGLHSGGNVEDGYLSGPYHPAFGELCESKIYLNLIKRQLPQNDGKEKEITVFVNDREISKMTGQKGENKKRLLEYGYKVKIKGDVTFDKYEMKIEMNER
jgi:histone acetyltransferase (RNA polymerase elongator complex component)